MELLCCRDEEEQYRQQAKANAQRGHNIIAILLRHALAAQIRASGLSVLRHTFLGYGTLISPQLWKSNSQITKNCTFDRQARFWNVTCGNAEVVDACCGDDRIKAHIAQSRKLTFEHKEARPSASKVRQSIQELIDGQHPDVQKSNKLLTVM